MRVVRSKTVFLTGNHVNGRATFHGPSVENAGANETLRVTVMKLVLDATARAGLPADMGHVQLRSNLAGTTFEPFQNEQLHASTILALAYKQQTFIFDDGGSGTFSSALSTRHLDRVELRLCDHQGSALDTAGTYDVILKIDVLTHM